MKTMTYGTIPSFDEFSAAFKEACGGEGYTFGWSPADKGRLREHGFVTNPYAYQNMGADDLYEFVKELLNAEADWPEDTASSIMHTLGFEWI